MTDLYKESWELYKEHSSSFVDDLQYFRQLCSGFRTLELFAGYGRISNYLVRSHIDLQTIEMSPDFSRFIDLPETKRHVGDVTKLVLKSRFDRIIAGYNSFCLLTHEHQILAFFQNLEQMLEKDGLISLSYYHPDAWHEAAPAPFLFRGQQCHYEPSFDLSNRKNKRGVWRDRYIFEHEDIAFEYPVRIYENHSDLKPFLDATGLRMVDTVLNYKNPEIGESGWIEYVISR